jgi:hypothetical protein
MKYRCKLPLILDTAHDLSGECRKAAGLKQLDRIHRTLPARTTPTSDPDVLQDEAGFAILDDPAGDFIYDDFRPQ